MTRYSLLRLARTLALQGVLITLAVSSVARADTPSPARKPNIVLILADDLGYGDVQCYNPQRGKIPTPNIDRLAAQGLRFTDAHSSSGVCSPSRYALLTGRYHWRSRLQAGIVGLWEPPLIATNRLTIAGLAKQYGYQTACVGKWHLGWDWPIAEGQRALFQKAKGPNDEAAPPEAHLAAWREVFSKPIPGGPTTRGFDSYFGTDVPNWPPYCFIENDRTVGLPSEFLPARCLGGTPRLASQPGPALKDWKLDAILPALAERAGAFIATQAKRDQPFLLYLPLTAPHEPIAVTDEWKGKSGLIPYADFVMETDAAIGRVLNALDKEGLTDNTLVIFTSDNGKASYTGAAELEQLGHYSSGPLRGYKTSVYEGGHREPFIMRWPGVTKAGSVCGQLAHQADVMATLADILGAKLPMNSGEDSFSLLPLLRGEDRPVREHAVSCAASGVQGIRKGSWKLVCTAPPQLYNLAEDLGETNDLAAAEPERVKELQALREKLIANGRSTPGEPQKNDVAVRRLPLPAAPAAGHGKGKK